MFITICKDLYNNESIRIYIGEFMKQKKFSTKILAISVIILLFLLAFTPSSNALNKDSENSSSNNNSITIITETNSKTKEDRVFRKSILFKNHKIEKIDNSFIIHVDEETSKTMDPGKPLLPVITRVFLLPFKTRIKGVTVCFEGRKEKKISSPIYLTPDPIPNTYTKIPSISSLNQPEDNDDLILFPEEQYTYHIGAGRYGDQIVNYLSVNLYPVKYNSLIKTIYYWNKAAISINYELPQTPTNFGDEYDMIIITPLSFSLELKPLVDHKNSRGIRTKLVTTNEIFLGTHFPVEGRDKAEKIKYFIKQALDEWGIKYVVLAGGRKGGLFNPWWWVPVRYSNLVDFIEYSFLTDYYFADIYDVEGNFSTWDSNGNGIFAEWSNDGKDIIDMYPEVSVGRLPCKNREQIQIMVDKIISYENTAYGGDWFNKFVGVGGDTFPIINNPYYEGELSTLASYEYLDGFEATFLWTSNETFTNKQDVINEVNKGCGFMLFSGHSNPHEWSTHPPSSEEWIDAPNSFEMDEYLNYDKQPIVIVGGCWISKFCTGLMNMLKGIITDGLDYFVRGPFPKGYYTKDWIPKCWSWAMCSQNTGGCIAIIGPIGLSYGIEGKNCNSGRSNFLEIQFFKSYAEGIDIIGETHLSQLIYYLNEFPPMDQKWDCKHIQESVLFGDPSLKIGGYPPK